MLEQLLGFKILNRTSFYAEFQVVRRCESWNCLIQISTYRVRIESLRLLGHTFTTLTSVFQQGNICSPCIQKRSLFECTGSYWANLLRICVWYFSGSRRWFNKNNLVPNLEKLSAMHGNSHSWALRKRLWWMWEWVWETKLHPQWKQRQCSWTI